MSNTFIAKLIYLNTSVKVKQNYFVGSYEFIGVNNYGSGYASASTSTGVSSTTSMSTDAGVTSTGAAVSLQVVL